MIRSSTRGAFVVSRREGAHIFLVDDCLDETVFSIKSQKIQRARGHTAVAARLVRVRTRRRVGFGFYRGALRGSDRDLSLSRRAERPGPLPAGRDERR